MDEKIQYYEGVYVDEFPTGPYFRDKFSRIPSNLRYDYTFNYNDLIDISRTKLTVGANSKLSLNFNTLDLNINLGSGLSWDATNLNQINI